VLEGLNPQQREAVLHPDGPELVIAGAGTGKTRVLTTRIAWLIEERGVHPDEILAFTFTNKAAREMQERVHRLVPGAAGRSWIGTFHATGVRLLRREGSRLGFDRWFTIFDADDSRTLIKRLLKRENADPKQFSPLFDGGSLFQRALRRIAGPGYAPPLLLTSAEFRFIVAEQLAGEGLTATRIVIEPEMRNTAPAVCMAALSAAETDPGTILLVLASDHLIRDEPAFHRAVAEGAAAARQGRIVTFGILPDRPETGYGYLELPEAPGTAATPFQIAIRVRRRCE